MSSDWPADEIEYLEEVIREYARYAENIGGNGLAANLLLYYRDELEETLEDLQGKIPLDMYLEKARAIDDFVRNKKGELISEIGVKNYKTERAVRKPPASHWWWHL